MTTSQFVRRRVRNARWRKSRPQTATLVMVGSVLVAVAIAIAWFTGHDPITTFFTHLYYFQEQPPTWLRVPIAVEPYLWVFPAALFLLVLMVMKVSPQPRPWSRVLVVGLLAILTVRYVLWRSLTTLNLSTPLNGTFSLLLLFLELIVMGSGSVQLFLMLRVRDRRREADAYAHDVICGHYTPSVDILIPTYDEPEFILRRTVIGCQAIDYSNKKIYILDDTRRPEIRALASELGCHYLTRSDNRSAKAGNLNHALPRTQGELIVVFDADFVPTRNFLTRTVGFFQNPTVALVQTPQTFYNTDPIARNLGLEDVLTPEEEVFYRQIQPIRDGAGSVICAGTSFVVRRQTLEETGGFVTDSLSEDYFTGIRISASGYRLIYLGEKLSAGLAAENIAAHALQRLRWARGTLQAFFIKSNPLTIPGLTLLQRLAHLEGLLHWFTSISRVGFLLFPLFYPFGIIPFRSTTAELLYFFLPFYLVQLSVFSWLNYRSRSAVLSDIYALVLCFPLAVTVIKVMLNPFSKGFRVTPKGTVSDRFTYNWNLALPLVILFVATAISLWLNLGNTLLVTQSSTNSFRGVSLGWMWSLYNLIVLGVGLLILLDVPRPSTSAWFSLRRTVRLQVNEQTFWGTTTMLSEEGAEVSLTQANLPIHPGESLPVKVDLMEEELTLLGHMVVSASDASPKVRVFFDPLPLAAQRALIEALFCRPGQWTSRQTPGELRSLFLLFRVLLKPRVLFNRKVDIQAIAVAQS
ncbi:MULTISPECIES: cellulose synthase catalytic subunit [unclassified Leptolyngbya]|uniref:glycosyltransferase family 2 protein n=1 Tax=unclassified Leptolyngbya TaxID=2650499 RepID=UPI001689BBEE|nr:MULTISPECIES: cellulose synthase catalytic subunit [unclassified Leptolyngbya]MBD1909957.1 glycosyltransferase [Leptolyngbya sp. FACHB-8]MBD2159062.1 glycosyltransferase [Leptolyngbya sp. FACHB-16]